MGTHKEKMAPYGWILILLMFTGCAHVPVASDVKVNDNLQSAAPLEPGDVMLIFGENAVPPDRNAAVDYFTAGCQGVFHRNTVGELAKTILKINPQPGRFTVRYVKETKKGPAPDRTEARPDSILARLDLTKEVVSRDHLRYAVHVKESFEASIHAPLYVSPFGVASCSNKTVLEAGVWDLPDEQFLGSFTVTAEGEYTVAAYIFHVIVFPDTQKDALEKLAQEIVVRLAGLQPLEDKDD
jgi:hypothetical protein